MSDTKYINMFIIYVSAELQMPSSNGSFITIKQKAITEFMWFACCTIWHKNISTNSAYFSYRFFPQNIPHSSTKWC